MILSSSRKDATGAKTQRRAGHQIMALTFAIYSFPLGVFATFASLRDH
jgi:hypothetical protein